MAGPKFNLEWKNVDKFLRFMKEHPEDVLWAAEGAVYVEGEQIMTAAKKITPVDEGILRNSGHVRLPVVEGQSVVVELGFGGPAGAGENTKDVGYAVWVHERPAYHKVGQWKYLETPLNQKKPTMAARLAKRIRARLIKKFGRNYV